MTSDQYNPIGKSFLIQKSWKNPDGTVSIEGWVSTNSRDLEKDIVEPEAFLGDTLSSYFERGAPLSSEHNTRNYPIGYQQKAAIVRDGVILQEAYHPTDPAEFEEVPTTGTGWYTRAVIDDAKAASAVTKGKVRSFSWIGNSIKPEPFPDGGVRHTKINPLMESTISAYPVNTTAVMRVAKAFGLEPEEKEAEMPETPKNPEQNLNLLEELLQGAATKAAQAETEKLAAKGTVTKAELSTVLTEFQARLMQNITDAIKVQKGATPEEDAEQEPEHEQEARKAGAGRKGTISGGSMSPREDNPVKYLVSKSRTDVDGKPGFSTFDLTDKELAWKLTFKGLTQGMSNMSIDGSDFADDYEQE